MTRGPSRAGENSAEFDGDTLGQDLLTLLQKPEVTAPDILTLAQIYYNQINELSRVEEGIKVLSTIRDTLKRDGRGDQHTQGLEELEKHIGDLLETKESVAQLGKSGYEKPAIEPQIELVSQAVRSLSGRAPHS